VNLNISEVAILRKMDLFLQKLGIPYAIVGARALVLLIELREKRGKGFGARPTQDIDFVVSIDNWKQYENMKSELAKLGFFQKSQEPEHRFFFDEIPIDIIPYGKGLIRDGKLIWPKSGIVMETAGLSEAFEHIDYVRLQKNVVVPVASLTTLIFLKIIAFQDRNYSRDLIDIQILSIEFCIKKQKWKKSQIVVNNCFGYFKPSERGLKCNLYDAFELPPYVCIFSPNLFQV